MASFIGNSDLVTVSNSKKRELKSLDKEKNKEAKKESSVKLCSSKITSAFIKKHEKMQLFSQAERQAKNQAKKQAEEKKPNPLVMQNRAQKKLRETEDVKFGNPDEAFQDSFGFLGVIPTP